MIIKKFIRNNQLDGSIEHGQNLFGITYYLGWKNYKIQPVGHFLRTGIFNIQ